MCLGTAHLSLATVRGQSTKLGSLDEIFPGHSNGAGRAVRPLALLPRKKARLIHYRGDWKTLRTSVENDQFDALNLELIPTVWAV